MKIMTHEMFQYLAQCLVSTVVTCSCVSDPRPCFHRSRQPPNSFSMPTKCSGRTGGEATLMMNPFLRSSALGALLEVKFGELAETVLVFVDSKTCEGRFSEIEELACSDAGCSRSAQCLQVCTMRSLLSRTRTSRPCALNIIFHGTTMRILRRKTQFEVILPGVVSTPRKLGTTRLWTLKRPSHPDTDAPFLEDRVIAVREETNMHLGFYQLHGMRSRWNSCCCGVKEFSGDGPSSVPQNLEKTVQPVVYFFLACQHVLALILLLLFFWKGHGGCGG